MGGIKYNKDAQQNTCSLIEFSYPAINSKVTKVILLTKFYLSDSRDENFYIYYL